MKDDLDRTMPGPEEERPLDELWHSLSGLSERPALSGPESDQLLERIEQSAGLSAGRVAARSGAPARPARRRIPIYRIGIAAAALAAVFLLFILPDRQVTISAAPGEQVSADLPDGTSVIVNSDSRLVYEKRGREGRFARLTGEVWLDVSSNGSAFRVETPNAVVTVLGTQFNVRSRLVAGDPVTDVRVFEGRVAVRALSADADEVIVDRDRYASITGNSAVSVERSAGEVAGAPEWTRGDLVFRDMPYHEAVDEASRRLGVSIGMSAPGVADRRINAAFRAPLNPSLVLEGLCRPFGLKFRSAADGYEIYQPASEQDRP